MGAHIIFQSTFVVEFQLVKAEGLIELDNHFAAPHEKLALGDHQNYMLKPLGKGG